MVNENGGIKAPILTLDELSLAIARRLDLDINEARSYAKIVIDFFGFEDRIIDNVLNPEERQLFYKLQEVGILTVKRDITYLHNGNEWRTHYWQLEKEIIYQELNSGRKLVKNSVKQKEQVYEDVYSSVTKDMWVTRKTLDY